MKRRKYSQKTKENLITVHKNQAGFYCRSKSIRIKTFYDKTLVIDHEGNLWHRGSIAQMRYTDKELNDSKLDQFLYLIYGHNRGESAKYIEQFEHWILS